MVWGFRVGVPNCLIRPNSKTIVRKLQRQKTTTRLHEDVLVRRFDGFKLALRFHVPNAWVLGLWVVILIVLVLGKYMMMRYLDA